MGCEEEGGLSRGPLRSFKYVPFRFFWFASLASIVSFFMSTIARGWLVLDITDSAFMVTSINAIGLLPTLGLSLYGGVIADRMERKFILIVSDIVSFLTIFPLVILLITDKVELWHIFALTLIHGSSFAIAMPSRASLVSNLVPGGYMSSAVALYTTIFSAGQMVAPGIAGYLINSYGMVTPFATSASILIPSVIMLMKVQPYFVTEKVHSISDSIIGSIIEGLAYVRDHSVLLGLILMGVAATVFAWPFQTLLPVFARDVLGVGAAGLGWMGAMSGAGSRTGSITIASLNNLKSVKILMLTGSITLGFLIILFAISRDYFVSRVILFGVGFCFQIFMTSNFTFVQLIAPDHIKGRVLSIRMIAFGLSPFGMLILGLGSEFLGPVVATTITATVSIILLASIIFFVSGLFSLDRYVKDLK